MKKKIMVLTLFVCLLISLSACLKKETKEAASVTEDNTQITSTTVETIGPIGLGRIPANDVIIVSDEPEEIVEEKTKEADRVDKTEETKEAEQVVKTEEIKEAEITQETMATDKTELDKNSAQDEQKNKDDEIKHETQGVQETTVVDSDPWGGGRA